MADHSKPLTTSTYANFVTELNDRMDDLATGLDPAVSTPSNMPTNSIRWSSSAKKWEKYNGSSWVDLESGYNVNINGTVGAGTPTTATFTTATINTAIVADGKTVGAAEIGYLDGVTSAIQTQLNGKVADTGDTVTGTLASVVANQTSAITLQNASATAAGNPSLYLYKYDNNTFYLGGYNGATADGEMQFFFPDGLTQNGPATVTGALGVTGATTLTGALAANGGITCDTDKFTVADTTGNTVVAGTLDVGGVVGLPNNVALRMKNSSGTAGRVVLRDSGNDVFLGDIDRQNTGCLYLTGTTESAFKFQTQGGTSRTVWHDGNCAASAVESGYQKLASGLIIQWGKYASGVSSNGNSGAQSLPMTFPTAALIAVLGENSTDTGDSGAGWTYQMTTSTITFYNPEGTSRSGVTYIALGY